MGAVMALLHRDRAFFFSIAITGASIIKQDNDIDSIMLL